MKLLVMQFPPTSRHLISLRSKYSPQHPVLKHPQSVFLPWCQRPSFAHGGKYTGRSFEYMVKFNFQIMEDISYDFWF
jgi:hypothetical protein